MTLRAAAYTTPGEDRAIAVSVGTGYLVAIADGAGGTGHGGRAAQLLMNGILMSAVGGIERIDWFDLLCDLDDQIAGRGETTGVVAWVDGGHVRGASVGDSVALLIDSRGDVEHLTANQRRKPLIGSGEALPVIFEAELRGRRLLLASDGLVNYVPLNTIAGLVRDDRPVSPLVLDLAKAALLPNGTRQDDIGIVLVSP